MAFHHLPGGPAIWRIAEQLDGFIADERIPDSELIRLAELQVGLHKLAKRHGAGLMAISRYRGLPDPGVRPSLDDARRDGSLEAAVGCIWRIRDFIERLELRYGDI